MSRRFPFVASAAALLVLAVAASASPLTPVSTIVGEFLYQPTAGTVKVPWTENCPSYATWFTKAEKEKTKLMAQLAKGCYRELGTSWLPGPYWSVAGDPSYVLGDNLSGRYVPELLGSAASGFVIRGDGIITDGTSSGFQAEISRDPTTGNLVLAFRGSEKSELADWGTDALQAMGSSATQYESAARLLKAVLDANPGVHIDVVGHSLGGGLTQYAMAKNDLQGRVEGYTFNSAGLSKSTIESLSASGIADAGAHLTNVRVVGDPVSFAESHLGNIFDVEKADGTGNAHSIDTMITSLDRVPMTDGPGKDKAPLASEGADGDDVLSALTEWLGEGLSGFLPEEISGPLLEALDGFVRTQITAGLLKAAGIADEKLGKWIAEAAALKKELYSLLPDDASRAAFDGLLSDVLSGNWDHLGESSKNAAYAVSDYYIDKGLREAGVGKDERAAILKTYHEAADAWFSGGDVSDAIAGNLESYVYGKIRDEVGEKAADSWKDVWSDLKAGTDPWENFGKATLDTIEFVGMRELADRLDAGFASLAKHCPWLSEFCKRCGIDKDSVMALAENVWGVVRGEGTVADKLEKTAEAVADQLYEWFSNFVSAAFEQLFEVVCAAVEWLADKTHGLIERLNDKVVKLHEKGFHPQFTNFVEYADEVREEREEGSTLVVDFGEGGGISVPAAGPVSAPAGNIGSLVHEEAF